MISSTNNRRAFGGDADGLAEHSIPVPVLAQHHELVCSSGTQIRHPLLVRAVARNLRGPPLRSVRGPVPETGEAVSGFWQEITLNGNVIPVQACYRPIGFQIARQSVYESGKVVSRKHRPSLPPGYIAGIHSCRG